MLQSEIAHLLRRRSDEDNSLFRTSIGELCVLAEKSVAGMDCLSVGLTRSFEQFRNGQVALCRLRWTDTNALICLLNVEGMAVGLGVHRDREDAHLPQSANDATRNGAAI